MTILGNGQARATGSGLPMSAARLGAKLADNYVPLKNRLTGWWTGRANEDNPPGAGGRDPEMAVDVDDDEEPRIWSPARMKIAQVVYGDGFVEPGGAQFARKLLAPADADPSKTILDLSVGLGGTAIALVRQHEVWMEGLQPESSLLEASRSLVRSNMLSRKIRVTPVDYSGFELKSEKYDVIYSRDRLYATPHKAHIIGEAARALKKGGKLLILDYMVASHDNRSPDFLHWNELEPEKPVPWTEGQYVKAIAAAGLNLRASHDFSDQYIEHIEAGWQKMLRELESTGIDRLYVSALIREGELWLARSRVLGAGVVTATRLIAMRT